MAKAQPPCPAGRSSSSSRCKPAPRAAARPAAAHGRLGVVPLPRARLGAQGGLLHVRVRAGGEVEAAHVQLREEVVVRGGAVCMHACMQGEEHGGRSIASYILLAYYNLPNRTLRCMPPAVEAKAC